MSRTELLTAGRVISMRGRLWRVDRVEEAEFSASPLDGRDRQVRRFHPLLEEITPGEAQPPSVNSIGTWEEQERMLSAYRLTMLHGTAPILGLQRSRAIPTDYQLVPLLLSMGQESVRLLIADDVGTGKTIEAGLVLAELIARGLARRILIVVPANLREQWSDALQHFFHLESTVVAGHLLPALERRLLPGQSVWSAHNIVIASIDYLKTRTETVLAHQWDAILVDEAHLVAKPHTLPGAPEPSMARWEFARSAAARARHLLLLTATPHNGYTDSFASLIEMLGADLVAKTPHGGVTVNRAKAKAHVVQRRRKDIEDWYESQGRTSPFPERRSDEHIIDLRPKRGTRETELKVLLREVGGYADALAGMDTSRPINGWVAAHLQKRALSSPAAIQTSLKNRLDAVKKAATSDTRNGSKAEAEAKAAVADLFESEDASDEEQSHRLDVASSSMSLDDEVRYLTNLYTIAKRITAAKDPKLAHLIDLIPRRIKAHAEVPRVMVFTKYTDTLQYLEKSLAKPIAAYGEKLPADLNVFSIDGSLSLADRRRVFRAFERAAPAVLIATDCISEGLNLQHACAEIIHYELPWNPNRLEQRNGRVDRFGQREPFVGINTLVLDDDLDATLLELIVKKADEMRAEYGFVPPFLANADILSHLSARAARRRIAPTLFEAAAVAALEDEAAERARAVIQDAHLSGDDLLDHAKTETIKNDSFYGHADVNLPMVEEALDRSRTKTGSAEAIGRFVTASLMAIRTIEVHTDPDGTFTISGADDRLGGVLPETTTRLSFDPADGFADPDIDVITVAHPLLRRLVDISADEAAHPDATGRIADRTSEQTDTVIGVCHLLVRYVARTDPSVLMEELVAVPIPVWGDDVPALNLDRLLAGPPGPSRGPDDISEAAAQILGRDDLEDRLQGVATERARSLSARNEGIDAPWASGLADIDVMSRDLLALTIVWPARI